MFELNNFDSMQVGLASPEKIREWSYGEVTKPETINYRTQKPERDGLFCERIFGPTKDWECHCGKYKRIRYKGVICDKCGVEVTKAKVRRERMGHIELVAPVSHIWYFKGVPSKMGTVLDLTIKTLEQVLYFTSFVVTDPGNTPLEYKQILNDREYREAIEMYGAKSFKAGMGAEAIKELLAKINTEKETMELKNLVAKSKGQKKIKAAKKLEVIESFFRNHMEPKWMVLDVLPVIPPELRPMVPLDGGRFATSDLNDLYRRVINRNNRLKKLMELGAPDIIIRNEKRMLQEAVDALIDNGRRGRPITGAGNRELKSLSKLLSGKQGRFRQNLLGKRVDYSGRSVIVVGPGLKIYQCGLPKEMALELFKPFVMKRLVDLNHSHNVKSAKKVVDRVKPVVWDVLEEVIKDHPVLLNRAPTLHRLGIQAFEPVLIEGKAIQLHPLTCTAFGADFDGDQMAVHVPLSLEAQAEARFLMIASNNILKPSDGEPITVPTQDMIFGNYYLTIERKGVKGEGRVFKDENEAVMAYEVGQIDLHAKIRVRMFGTLEGKPVHHIVETTVGRLIFNRIIPQDLGFVKRIDEASASTPEINFVVRKKDIKAIIKQCFDRHGSTRTAILLDNLKDVGFKFATKSALTACLFDIKIPAERDAIIKDGESKALELEKMYNRGLITETEKSRSLFQHWKKVTDHMTEIVMKAYDENNPFFMMSDSGARGSEGQINQLSGMRGIMASTSGKIIEVPIRSNFKNGANVIEYFISTRGGRKGIVDKALRTASAGYLTRRLVDVAQDVVVTEDDCFSSLGEKVRGMEVSAIKDGSALIEKLSSRISGRFAVADVVNPATGEIFVKANEMITEAQAAAIEKAGIESVSIRTVFTCKCKTGVCKKCYGRNMASREPINIGEAVGIIAAQSIGEPGTQLTMDSKHTGGVVVEEDITHGLSRIGEIFEVRKPKGVAVVSEVSGTIKSAETAKQQVVVKTNEGVEVTYAIPFDTKLRLRAGDKVEPGMALTEGPLNPHDILKTKGIKDVQNYILSEIQKVYTQTGVYINDKHIEIILRQMLKKVKIEDSGDSSYIPGEFIDLFKYEAVNDQLVAEGKEPATAKRALLSITKASLKNESFLSAASFQETVKVLTDAAIENKIDYLSGLKENVIIGKLIPAGTGLKRYREVMPLEAVLPSNQ